MEQRTHAAATPTSYVAFRPAVWIGLAAAAALLVAVRLHAFNLPLEPDECNYAYIGQRLLHGDRLYVDVWDHQPPGVFVLFAGIIGVFGDQPLVFRWMATLFSLASLWLVFAILRRTVGAPGAVLGACLFAIVSSDPGTAGEGCNREIYMTTLILAAWFGALRVPGSLRWCLASGTALALASILKPVVAVHWLLLAVWIALADDSAGVAAPVAPPETSGQAGPGPTAAKSRLLRLAAFAIAPIVVWLVTFAWFAATGRWHDFVDAVFLANVTYTETGEPFYVRFLRFFAPVRHPFLFDSALPLWLAGGAGFLWLVIHSVRKRDRAAALVALLIVASFFATCLPGRFWPHYYYLLIAPLVIGSSVLVSGMSSWGRQRLPSRPAQMVSTFVIYAALPAALLVTQYRDYLSQPPLGITLKRYNTRDFWGRAQGLNVRKVTRPDDTIFVFGNDASIYYYSRRRCASRYTMLTGLASGMEGADGRRKILMTELRAAPPRLIVLVFDIQPWPEWKAFLAEYYGQPVGWDRHDRTGEPIMAVLARKDAPIKSIDWNWDRSEVAGP